MTTKVTQFSVRADKALDSLSEKIGYEKAVIERATEEHNALWTEVFDLFSEFDRDGREARFLASDGHYLYRQVRNGSPKLDEAKLKKILFERLPKTEANRIWNAITERKVNSSLLEMAVQKQKISAAIVDECLTVPEPTEARVRQPFTKEDKEKAAVLGLEVGV